MATKCPFCQHDLRPAVPVVEIVGGILDPPVADGEAAAFVLDEDVLQATCAHLKCLTDAILAARKAK